MKRAHYLQVILLIKELTYYDFYKNYYNLYSKPVIEMQFFFRELNFNILTLCKFKEFLNSVNQKNIGNSELHKLKKSIQKELEFIKHLRNKISGHLDEDLLQKAAQWEPFVFYEEIVGNEYQVILAYKTLFESAINSYIDENGQHKIYKTEIDLFYPENNEEFIKSMIKLNENGFQILLIIKEWLENEDIKINKEQVFVEAQRAGETDFSLNSRSKNNTK